jgi:hypothetical protein
MKQTYLLNMRPKRLAKFYLLCPSDESCVLSFDILLIYYLSKVNLQEILKIVYLQSTRRVAVTYINSIHDSRLDAQDSGRYIDLTVRLVTHEEKRS